MKPVLLINPNSSENTTAAMLAIARRHLPDVQGWTNEHAPKMITDQDALDAAADQITTAALPEARAIIVAAFGDPGVEALARKLAVPVVGIAEASARAASQGGAAYTVVTTTHELAPAIDARMRAKGGGSYLSCFLTGGDPVALAADQDALDDALVRACDVAARAGAKHVIIGGGPLAEAAIRIAPRVSVKLVQPLVAACAEIAAL